MATLISYNHITDIASVGANFLAKVLLMIYKMFWGGYGRGQESPSHLKHEM